MEIRPGQSIKIVFNIDHIRETTDVRNSFVYDVVEDRLIIAQTYPPILKSKIGRAVIVTYLATGTTNPARFGLDATILELRSDYALSTGNTTRAAALLRKSDPVEYNLRFFYRVEPPSNVGLDMYVYRKRVNIIDISIGGVKISHDKALRFEPKKIMPVSLSIDGEPFEVNAIVSRTWQPQELRMIKSLEFAALEFADTSRHFKDILGKKIFEIQRELRYKEIS